MNANCSGQPEKRSLFPPVRNNLVNADVLVQHKQDELNGRFPSVRALDASVELGPQQPALCAVNFHPDS
jgi:hypothetical protein